MSDTLLNQIFKSINPPDAFVGNLEVTKDAIISGNCVIDGNLEVNGQETILNVETIHVEDNEIVLNANVLSGAPTLNAGLRVKRGNQPDATLQWNETTDKWNLSDITVSSITGTGALTIWTPTGTDLILRPLSGRVGINQTSPATNLDVNGFIQSNIGYWIKKPDNTLLYEVKSINMGEYAEIILMKDNGTVNLFLSGLETKNSYIQSNLLIGATSNPAGRKLLVNGSIGATSLNISGITDQRVIYCNSGSIEASGLICNSSTGNFSLPSNTLSVGNISLGTNTISTTSGNLILSSTSGTVSSGNITLNTNTISTTTGNLILSSTSGTVSTGNITLNTNTISTTSGELLLTSAGGGNVRFTGNLILVGVTNDDTVVDECASGITSFLRGFCYTNNGARSYYMGASNTNSLDYVICSRDVGGAPDPNITVAYAGNALRTTDLYLNKLTPATSILGVGVSTNHASAALQVDHNSRGFLMPRMDTTARTGISSPAAGLQVYDTSLNTVSTFNGTNWFNPTWIRWKVNSDFTFLNNTKITDHASTRSADNELSYINGDLSMQKAGIYMIQLSYTFYMNGDESDITLELLNDLNQRETLSRSFITNNGESTTTYNCASLNWIINHTNAARTYYIRCNSLANNTAALKADSSYGMIYRYM